MRASQIKISIVFPTFNGENVIFHNLLSIKNLNNLIEIEVIIVDNNSTDSTKSIINSFKKDINITLINQNTNLGFARACNIAVSKAKGEYIYITNQDVAFPKDFFSILLKLYKKLKKDHEIIISPAVIFPGRFINYYGAKVHFLGFSYTPLMYQKIPKQITTFRTKKASGCSIFMKRKLFLDLNGFDPNFFMYHEDTDFSLKAIRNGIQIYTTNESMLYHQKIHMSINDFSYYYIERNRYLVLCKNIKNLRNLIPYIILSEFILIFQAVITRKIKLRLKIYKFLILNNKLIRYLRYNKNNNKYDKIEMNFLESNLDSIILGKILSKVKILRIFLKILNSIF
ncbi:MAG: glycosyltransferase family 2 protein [Promethearchaeota archaeon]